MQYFNELFNAFDEIPDSSRTSVDNTNQDTLDDKEFSNELLNLSNSLMNDILVDTEDIILTRQKENEGFCNRTYTKWKPAFDLLEIFILFCLETGSHYNNSYRCQAANNNDIVFDVVTKLHGRACQIAQEILCLMKAGFADGAHARWRALHEVTVAAAFIQKHGNECACRYLEHDIVESYKIMESVKNFESRTNIAGPTDEEFEETSELYNKLKDKFGKNFTLPNGWAKEFIKGNATIINIEKDVELDHTRPYYKWACQNVHAGPKGVNKKLGVPSAEMNIILTGQSSFGMTDPAHHTAITLGIITSTLIVASPDHLKSPIIIETLKKLMDKIGKTFMESHNSINGEQEK